MDINWSDPKAKISKYFTVREALWLPSWGVLHTPTDQEKVNILRMATQMDVVREFVGKPISIHCWIRPGKVTTPFDDSNVECKDDAQRAALASKDYNAFVKGAKRSAHLTGMGVDWDCGEDCDVTRAKLLPKLEAYQLCMENVPKGPWVHLDDESPTIHGGARYFKP